MELYHAVGEDLPENRTHFGGDAAFKTGKVMEPPLDIFGWTPEAAICERAAHFVSPDPSVPKRHLPPGGPATLFWQFKAWWAALEEHQKMLFVTATEYTKNAHLGQLSGVHGLGNGASSLYSGIARSTRSATYVLI